MAFDWERIVRQNAGHVVNAALRVLGNAADAEDVAQSKRAFVGKTDKNVRMGAAAAEVIKAYGEPEILTQPIHQLNYQKQGIEFGFFDRRLSHIFVSSPRLRPMIRDGIAVLPQFP